jgi:hypothetical protein
VEAVKVDERGGKMQYPWIEMSRGKRQEAEIGAPSCANVMSAGELSYACPIRFGLVRSVICPGTQTPTGYLGVLVCFEFQDLILCSLRFTSLAVFYRLLTFEGIFKGLGSTSEEITYHTRDQRDLIGALGLALGLRKGVS